MVTLVGIILIVATIIASGFWLDNRRKKRKANLLPATGSYAEFKNKELGPYRNSLHHLSTELNDAIASRIKEVEPIVAAKAKKISQQKEERFKLSASGLWMDKINPKIKEALEDDYNHSFVAIHKLSPNEIILLSEYGSKLGYTCAESSVYDDMLTIIWS